MSKKPKPEDEAAEVTAFFNRGRRSSIEIVRDNEQLRSKIRKLEQALRVTTDAGRRVSPPDGGDNER